MKSIERRIEMLEKKLKVGHQVREHVIVLDLVQTDGSYLTLPEPTEQWLTYQEALKKKLVCGSRLIILKVEDELKVRIKAGPDCGLSLVGTKEWIAGKYGEKVNARY